MTYVLGLTGSIGMGKSTTAQLLRQIGIPVWDADDAVHRLYAAGGAAVPTIAQLCPTAILNGGIDRSALRSVIETDPDLLTKIQGIVHPLVAADRAAFIDATPAPIIVLDIPLLFEIGADAQCHGVLVVTTSPKEQKSRVLGRGLTEAQFNLILSRQMPDADKRARATWVVETHSLAHVQAQLHQILDDIRKATAHA